MISFQSSPALTGQRNIAALYISATAAFQSSLATQGQCNPWIASDNPGDFLFQSSPALSCHCNADKEQDDPVHTVSILTHTQITSAIPLGRKVRQYSRT